MNVTTEQQRQLLQQSIEEYDESATDGLIIEQKPPTLTKTDISINTKEISEYSGTGKTTIIDFQEKVEAYAGLKG